MKPATNGIHLREDVWKLPAWDDTLLWYAKAVRSMRKKPITDPTSWRYQAAIHAYARDFDPLAVNGESLPTPLEQSQFWGKCQHGSWYFLPWHRAYLACFERIVRAEIMALGGPDGWALPYWNYSDLGNEDALLVRPEFRAKNLPDGTPNALAEVERGADAFWADRGAKTGDFGLTEQDAALDCLNRGKFDAKPNSGTASFGGGQSGFAHNGRSLGDLEACRMRRSMVV